MVEDMQPVPASEACAHALEHTKGPLDESWQEEQWSKGPVEVALLRTAHPDFDGVVRLTKNERMADILERSRGDILAGTFPRAGRIEAGGEIPAVMLRATTVVSCSWLMGRGECSRHSGTASSASMLTSFIVRACVRSRRASDTQPIHDQVRPRAKDVRPWNHRPM